MVHSWNSNTREDNLWGNTLSGHIWHCTVVYKQFSLKYPTWINILHVSSVRLLLSSHLGKGYIIKECTPYFGEYNRVLLQFEKMQTIKSQEEQTLVQELLLYGLDSITGASLRTSMCHYSTHVENKADGFLDLCIHPMASIGAGHIITQYYQPSKWKRWKNLFLFFSSSLCYYRQFVLVKTIYISLCSHTVVRLEFIYVSLASVRAEHKIKL